MTRFLFGQGGMILFHVALYLLLLLGVILPMAAFLPLKRPGEKPDTASPGSFMMVMFIALTMALLVFLTLVRLAWTAEGPWYHKAMIVLGISTLVPVLVYFPAAQLALKQNHLSMLLLALCVAVLTGAMLIVLNVARTRPPAQLSLHLSWPLAILFGLLSLPAVGIIVLTFISIFIMPFRWSKM